MKETYSIADVVQITGLSDRTIRHHISQKVLDGEKINGVWRFTPEQLGAYMNDPNVLPGIRAKKNAIIYDFLMANHHKEQEMCLIADLPGENSRDASAFFCEAINSGHYQSLCFSFDSLAGQTPRVILNGQPDEVLALMQRFYEAR